MVGSNGTSPFKGLLMYFFVDFPDASIILLSYGLLKVPRNVIMASWLPSKF